MCLFEIWMDIFFLWCFIMQIAPENTMIAFEYAADSNVFAFESDVIIR